MKSHVLAGFIALTSTAIASADAPPVTIDHARILLGDLIHDANEDDSKLDLGPAPPPGGSILLSRDAIISKMGDRASSVKLPLTPSFRVVSAGKILTSRQLSDFVEPSIAASLHAGVKLVRVDSSVGTTLSPRMSVKKVTLPRFHRVGTEHATAVVELARDGEVVVKMPIAVTLDVDTVGARPDVPRGSHISLIVREGKVEIHADATTLADGDVGDLVQVTIVKTNRVASARLVTDGSAELMERR